MICFFLVKILNSVKKYDLIDCFRKKHCRWTIEFSDQKHFYRKNNMFKYWKNRRIRLTSKFKRLLKKILKWIRCYSFKIRNSLEILLKKEMFKELIPKICMNWKHCSACSTITPKTNNNNRSQQITLIYSSLFFFFYTPSKENVPCLLSFMHSIIIHS